MPRAGVMVCGAIDKAASGQAVAGNGLATTHSRHQRSAVPWIADGWVADGPDAVLRDYHSVHRLTAGYRGTLAGALSRIQGEWCHADEDRNRAGKPRLAVRR